MDPYDETDPGNDVQEKQRALLRLVEDPLFWREQDPEFRRYVENGFKSVYGNEGVERDATGRTIEPEPRSASLPPFKPAVTEDDVNLAGGIGDNQPNRWRDVWKVQKGLFNTGHYALDLTKEKSGERSTSLDRAIRDFQREKREEIDGTLLPGGPTITRMKESLLREWSPRLEERKIGAQLRAPQDAQSLLVEVLSPLLAPRNASSAPNAQSPAQPPGASDDGVVSTQAPGPALPPTAPRRPRTHREAQDRSMERLVPYPVIDLPERTASRREPAPVLRGHAARSASILSETPGRFVVRENPEHKGRQPGYASHNAGVAAVELFDQLIREEAARAGVDPNLIRAIMYVENAQGHYFGAARAAEGLGLAKSIFPMNIRPDIWAGLGFTERDLHNPRTNIRAAAILVRRIHERLDDPTVSKFATLYNLLPETSVTAYGARVAEVYRTRAWDRFKER